MPVLVVPEIHDVEQGNNDEGNQLPSREEYITQVGVNPTKGSRNRFRCICLSISIPLIFAIAFTALGVMLAEDGYVPDLPGAKETPAPSTEESEDEFGPIVPDGMDAMKIIEFVTTEMKWSDVSLNLNSQSPQWQAANWLADFDDKKVTVADTREFRERYALAVIYFALGGREWSQDLYFLENVDICEWQNPGFDTASDREITLGVDCSCAAGSVGCDEGSVKRLLLPSLRLKGIIPPEIELLYDLETLQMNSNDIEGELPETLVRMPKLKHLLIGNNFLNGSLPEDIGEMNLEYLDLHDNFIEGELPATMVNLTNLHTLNIVDNLIGGTLEPLMFLDKLTGLLADRNEFTGELTDDFIDSLPFLQVLDLSQNLLNGTLPSNLFDHEYLIIIDLHGNDFTGNIPIVTKPTVLQFLALQKNKLDGPIPESLGVLTNLYHLDLSNNLLTGIIPGTFDRLTRLEYFFVAFNEGLTPAVIPPFLADMSSLVDLSLQRTNRIGSIPASLSALKKLQYLDLADNQLEGSVPPEIGELAQLRFVLLNHNQFSSNVPEDLAMIPNLQVVNLQQNNFEGTLQTLCFATQNKDVHIQADCHVGDPDIGSDGAIDCPCCDICCHSPDSAAVEEACERGAFVADLDPLFNSTYIRTEYDFNFGDHVYAAFIEEENNFGGSP